MSRSLTGMGSKQNLIKLKSYFVVLKPNLLPTIMAVVELLQDAAQFNIHLCLDIKKQKFHLRVAL